MSHIGSKRSNLRKKRGVHSRCNILCLILMKLGQNVYPCDIMEEFENMSIRTKK